ncbi:hypothetical protein BGX21_002787 [Mortierella sp. AD011]|nr:hypothetical protein BGX20_002287 [Mortierella sp. AD010]KAF9378868.1 hypothetical protein BGX21_002787 [Mortierella sp. AD011]
MSEDTGISSTNPRAGTSAGRPAGSGSSGSIGSIQTPTATPAGRLTSLRGRGGSAAASSSTRGGANKTKFTPTIPTKRNKKDAAPSLLEEARAGTEAGGSSHRGRGGRGGRGAGRGRGRVDEMNITASGPFSLGPAAFARSRQVAAGGGASGAHSSYTGIQAIKVEGGDLTGEDRDYYGAAAVDMKFGSVATDASAPTGLENLTDDIKTANIKEEKLKEQDMESSEKGKDFGIKSFEGTMQDENDGDDEDIKLKLEGPAQDLLPSWAEDQMFFFQFPSVMPAFKPRVVTQVPMSSVVSSSASSPGGSSMYSTPDGVEKSEYGEDGLMAVKSEPMDTDRPILIADNDSAQIKGEQRDSRTGLGAGADGSGTSSAPAGQRAKPKASATTANKPVEKEEPTESHLEQEGKIGRLLIYKSGKVKMQIGDIVMDVSAGSECSFLQDVVVVDSNNKQAFVMGSVQKRMVCVPNLTQLLSGLEVSDA